MRAIRLTLILAGGALVVAVGLGYLFFRTPGTGDNTNTAQQNTNADLPVNETTENTNTSPVPGPQQQAADIRTIATVFAERFENYNEQTHEKVVPSVAAFLTSANLIRLEKDAERIAQYPDPKEPRIHAATVISVKVLSQTTERAIVDVQLQVEIYGGIPLIKEGTSQTTLRLMMVNQDGTWKIENAAL